MSRDTGSQRVSQVGDGASDQPQIVEPTQPGRRRVDPGPTRPRSRASVVALAPASAATPPRTLPPLPGPRYLLGEWLVRRGVLTRHQLFLALSTSHQLECRLGDAAIVMGFVQPNLLEAEAEILERRLRSQGNRGATGPQAGNRTRRGAQPRMFAGYAWERGGRDTVELAV